MLKTTKFTSAFIAIAMISACSAKSNTSPFEKPYLSMTEAEQQDALDTHITKFRAEVEKALPAKQRAQAMKMLNMRGDAEKDMIYSIGTFPKKVSTKELKQVKLVLAQMQDQLDVCAKPEVKALNKLGVGFQVRMVDTTGRKLYESDVCHGVKKQASKLRGTSTAR